jgi:pyridoxal phosphate enzyme (YggS family)
VFPTVTFRARLEENLKACLGRIEAARGDRSATLVAVTKSVDTETSLELAALGAIDLGESRPQEFERKRKAFEEAGVEVRWHFIGHLQRNKARGVVGHAHTLHSLDSLRLLETVARIATEIGRAPQVFLQVKLNAEAAKGGFLPGELPSVLQRASELDLPIHGLMTMAPLVSLDDGQLSAARDTFGRLAELGKSLPPTAFATGRPLYSMGMSGDFEEALAEGADLVRVGSALFQGLPRPNAPHDQRSSLGEPKEASPRNLGEAPR